MRKGEKYNGLHRHHIVPKHMGGTDDPSNLVSLTVEQHAEAHRQLFLQYNLEEDRIAWQTLTGQIGKDMARRLATAAANRKRIITPEIKEKMRKAKLGKPSWNKGIAMREESKEKCRAFMKGRNWKIDPTSGKRVWI